MRNHKKRRIGKIDSADKRQSGKCALRRDKLKIPIFGLYSIKQENYGKNKR